MTAERGYKRLSCHLTPTDQNDPGVHPGQMGRSPQRETSQSRLTANAGDVVAFAYDIYTTSNNNKGVLGGTLTGNRRRTRLKLLYWDGTGLWVMTKRLEKGTFSWPKDTEGKRKLVLRPEALAMLTDGVDLRGAKLRPWYERGE